MDGEPDAWALIGSAHLIAECCAKKLLLTAGRSRHKAKRAAAQKTLTCMCMQHPAKVLTICQIKTIAVTACNRNSSVPLAAIQANAI